MSEPKSTTCTRLAEVMSVSHDCVNRFLLRESYEPKDLFNEAKQLLDLNDGTLSVDDTVIDKFYSQYIELVGHFWSGKHHRAVKGINLITLYYTDTKGQHLPVNYRIYDKSEGKTKNDYFQDMLHEVISWGLNPAFVTGDSWYACTGNLKTVKNHHKGFLFAIKGNRRVSIEKGQWVQVQNLDVPEEGLIVWLRDFGTVKVFRTQRKDELRHYIVSLDEQEQLAVFNRKRFQHYHDHHWQIEQYHRVIKQVCHIEKFQVRKEVAVRNHLFAGLCGYIYLQRIKAADVIETVYQLQNDLFKPVVESFIRTFMQNKEYLNPQLVHPVNA